MASSSSNSPSTSKTTILDQIHLFYSNLSIKGDSNEPLHYLIKCYLYGQVTILPSLIRIIITFILNKKKDSTKNLSAAISLLKLLLKTIVRSLRPSSFPFAFAISIGGTKWLESRFEPLIRRSYLELRARRKERKNQKGKAAIEGMSVEKQVTLDEKIIKALTTFASSTLAALVSISLLQSSSSYTRQRLNPLQLPTGEGPSPSPYPSLLSPDVDFTPISSPINSGTTTPTTSSRNRIKSNSNSNSNSIGINSINQSPTLDLTLFIFVRGADSLIRFLYEQMPSTNKKGSKRTTLMNLVASQADTLVFWLSVSRIMWCWMYDPSQLPPSYNTWILKLARFDPRLLDLLRYARSGEYVYGQKPNETVALMSRGIAEALGKPEEFVNPLYIRRLDCSVVHGKLGEGTCEVNAIKRWIRAFGDALLIYGPVHLFPQLIFNFSTLTKSPLPSLLHILLAASRSSAFLATFISSIYASVCFARTRLASLLPRVNQQFWDSGFCAGLGCVVCGFSVLIENQRRRREMSLYCAPRALVTLIDLIPGSTLLGRGEGSGGKWIERFIFSISTGITLTSVIHRPDLVSGVVRGLLGKAVGNWNNRKGGKL